MSVTVNKSYTVTFATEKDKDLSLNYLLDNDSPYTATAVDTIVLREKEYEALKNQGIQFK